MRVGIESHVHEGNYLLMRTEDELVLRFYCKTNEDIKKTSCIFKGLNVMLTL